LAGGVLSLGMFILSTVQFWLLSPFALILFLWNDAITKSLGGPVGGALGHLSLLKHYNNLVQAFSIPA